MPSSGGSHDRRKAISVEAVSNSIQKSMNARSVRKNHICWIKVMAIWCTFHKIKVEGNLVYLTYREEKKRKYTTSEGNGYTFKS
ncbi:hypothetical protein P8452_70587 [Trifolium repens]|nr:hypothetical protein P8452_70587 [Trifolium repens]